MGHTIGDGIIVTALAAAFVAYLYFKHIERQRRLEIVHQERLAAMEKGIPLPEFPLDPPSGPEAAGSAGASDSWHRLVGPGLRCDAGPAIDPECPGALAAAAAACVPRHRVDPVLRPCLRARALSPPRTPIGLTSGSSRGVASRPREQRRRVRRARAALSWTGVSSGRFHSRPGVRAGSRRRRPGRDAARASRSRLVPGRGQVRVLDIPHRVQPGAQRQGARPLSSTSRERSGARGDTVAGSRSVRSVAGRAAPAGCPCVRRRAARGVPVGVAPALLAGCKHERNRGDARCAGEHREVIPPPCQTAAARTAYRARFRCTMTK